MSKMLVVAFDEEAKAYEGARAMRDLHREGDISVYAAAVVARDAEGKVSVKDEVDEGPIGTAVGMLTGGLIGLLAGPQGMVIGAAAGSMMGASVDLINLGVGSDFVDDVADQLAPGKVAVVAEVDEYWTTPVDTRMEALGGTVVRRFRADVEDEQIQRDIDATDAELDELEAEWTEASEENKARLQAKIDAAKVKLQDAKDRAETKYESMKAEGEAKVKAVNEQMASAKDEAKEKLQAKAEEIKADYEARSAKLKQSWDNAKEKLSS